MLPQVYIETSVISYLTARPPREFLRLARQAYTQSWWELRDTQFSPHISNLVLEEVSAGDYEAAQRRLSVCAGLPLLSISDKADALSREIINVGLVPETEPEDALHIAIAVDHAMDYIATWNFAHLVGAQARFALQTRIAAWGYKPPLLVTPEELLEEFS